MSASPRRKRRTSKGRWMKLRSADLLAKWMVEKDYSQARLARHAEVSRQFIHLLVTGQRTTCTDRVGRLIEEALGVVDGTLFDEQESPVRRHRVAPKGKDVAA